MSFIRILELVGVVASFIAVLSLFYGAAERPREEQDTIPDKAAHLRRTRVLRRIGLASLVVWFLWQLAFVIL